MTDYSEYEEMISSELVKLLIKASLEQDDFETAALLKGAAVRIAEFIGESYNDLS
jgi:hypothetical protein